MENFSKKFISNNLKILMKKDSLDKISIQDIVDKCKMNRKTFYYHFSDKGSLLSWIFESETTDLMRSDINDNPYFSVEVAKYLLINRDFYKNALESCYKDILINSIYNICYKSNLREFMGWLGDRNMPQDDMELLVRYFTNATVQTLIQSITDMKYSYEAAEKSYFNKFSRLTQDLIEYSVKKYV